MTTHVRPLNPSKNVLPAAPATPLTTPPHPSPPTYKTSPISPTQSRISYSTIGSPASIPNMLSWMLRTHRLGRTLGADDWGNLSMRSKKVDANPDDRHAKMTAARPSAWLGGSSEWVVRARVASAAAFLRAATASGGGGEGACEADEPS